MMVEYIQHMGSDLTVANAARVSFDKESEWEWVSDNDPVEAAMVKQLHYKDAKLIRYLADHNHWTPFGHCQATFRIKAPIFVARQLGKHQVGMVWNEVSRRYVDSEPEFYEPKVWRKRANNVKQGSLNSGLTEHEVNITLYEEDDPVISTPKELQQDSMLLYEHLLQIGICPEQARMVLPQSMYTQWYWTGSLAAWARVCKLRLDPHSQQETRRIAELISAKCEKIWPVSWKELMS